MLTKCFYGQCCISGIWFQFVKKCIERLDKLWLQFPCYIVISISLSMALVINNIFTHNIVIKRHCKKEYDNFGPRVSMLIFSTDRAASKITLGVKVVKIGSKIIILLLWSKLVKQALSNLNSISMSVVQNNKKNNWFWLFNKKYSFYLVFLLPPLTTPPPPKKKFFNTQ